MELSRIEHLKEIDTENIASDISRFLRGVIPSVNESVIYLSAYVFLKAKRMPGVSLASIADFASTSGETYNRAMFIKENLGRIWEHITLLSDRYDEEELEALLLFYEPGNRSSADSTPVGVAQLAARLLEIKPGDRVADFGAGRGGFIRECYGIEPDAHYFGNDIYTPSIEIAAIRAELLGGNIELVQEDIFDMKDRSRTFDLAFANYPMGMRTREAWRSGINRHEELLKEHPAFARAVSLDWLFNKVIYGTIAGPRRAICIMSNGSTWNTLDRDARKHFISSGCVEAVIALPSNLFENTGAGTVMIIFSHGNMSTMMVDAREMCSHGRRINTITSENIYEIEEALRHEGAHSKRVSYKELQANDYVLNPVRYMTEEIVLSNGVPFESVIKRITRGAPIGASTLDELASDTPTDIRYIMLSNISDGIIDDELTYLKSVEPRMERYFIKDRSLIIAKNGYPFKIAVAEVPEGSRLMVNANAFIIELDETKADPYFVKAFLESEDGEAVLKSITVGGTLPNIGVDQLRKISIPCPPISEQKEIADKCLVLMDEVKLLRRKLSKATSNLKHLYDEGKEV